MGEHAARTCREAIARHPGLYYVQTSAANYETMCVEATKGAALVWLSERMGWSIAQTVAFGDSVNDEGMFAVADTRVLIPGEPYEPTLRVDLTATDRATGVAQCMKALFG